MKTHDDINRLIAERDELEKKLDAVNDEIREGADIPYGWRVGSPDDRQIMYGEVTLFGADARAEGGVEGWDADDSRVALSIWDGGQYQAAIVITDFEHDTKSPWINPEAVRALLALYDEMKAKKKRDREASMGAARERRLEREQEDNDDA